MKIKVGKLMAIAGSVLFCIALPAFGQVASVTFTGGYTTTWGNSSGDFGAGIYSATINGTTSLSGIICDDFKDEIVTGENWNAYTVQVSTLTPSNIGNTIFGNTVGLNGYTEVAALVSMMFDGSSTYVGGGNSISVVTQAEISSAIWDITSGDTLTGLDANAQPLVDYVQLQYDIHIPSEDEASLSQDTNLRILVPTPQGPNEAQEMWTN